MASTRAGQDAGLTLLALAADGAAAPRVTHHALGADTGSMAAVLDLGGALLLSAPGTPRLVHVSVTPEPFVAPRRVDAGPAALSHLV